MAKLTLRLCRHRRWISSSLGTDDSVRRGTRTDTGRVVNRKDRDVEGRTGVCSMRWVCRYRQRARTGGLHRADAVRTIRGSTHVEMLTVEGLATLRRPACTWHARGSGSTPRGVNIPTRTRRSGYRPHLTD
ncbi:hypothetical protein OH77DRAFT_152145 [Trametes cingulata]|nr:hypothetical protein OH77DRAFT_152145 [Trametes cingulata]